jgi:hypothetical protein
MVLQRSPSLSNAPRAAFAICHPGSNRGEANIKGKWEVGSVNSEQSGDFINAEMRKWKWKWKGKWKGAKREEDSENEKNEKMRKYLIR